MSSVHSVTAMGPSRAAMISATLTSLAARAKRYPPEAPRVEVTNYARANDLSTLLTVGLGIPVSSANARTERAAPTLARCEQRTTP